MKSSSSRARVKISFFQFLKAAEEVAMLLLYSLVKQIVQHCNGIAAKTSTMLVIRVACLLARALVSSKTTLAAP